MAEDEEKKVIISTEVQAKNAQAQLQLLSQSIFTVVYAVQQVLSINAQLMASNMGVRNAEWAVIDAKRANVRLTLQQLDLDRQQSKLNVELAERQLMITQRTGRRLDVMQAQLNLEKANRDVALTNFDIETRRWEQQKNTISAGDQLNLILAQQKLMYLGLYIQIGATLAQLTILIAAHWAEITAMTVKQAVMTAGLSLIVTAAAIGGSYALIESMKPEPLDKGSPPSTTNYNTSTTNINVSGNMDRDTYNYVAEREQMYQQTGGGIRRRAST